MIFLYSSDFYTSLTGNQSMGGIKKIKRYDLPKLIWADCYVFRSKIVNESLKDGSV